MTNAEQFQLCLQMARAIVAAARAQAPEGCDPQNTWVAVAGTAISVGVGAYQANQAKKQGDKAAAAASANAKAGQLPPPPEFIPADFNTLNAQAIAGDKAAARRMQNFYAKMHPGMAGAEKLFEESVLKDQQGEHELLPAVQNQFMTAGIGKALDAFGDVGPVTAPGSAAEATVAKNLGLNILAYQDRNRQNRERSLTLGEEIFPKFNIGLSGQDAANIALSNLAQKNAWEQENYKIQAENQATRITGANAAAKANADASAAQSQLYGQMATTAVKGLTTAYGNYRADHPTASAASTSSTANWRPNASAALKAGSTA